MTFPPSFGGNGNRISPANLNSITTAKAQHFRFKPPGAPGLLGFIGSEAFIGIPCIPRIDEPVPGFAVVLPVSGELDYFQRPCPARLGAADMPHFQLRPWCQHYSAMPAACYWAASHAAAAS